MLSITLRQLEYVTAIETYRSVSSAAAALNVSQPSLSVALHQVEDFIGKPLFLRRPGNPMVPTSFGRAFLKDAAKIVDDVTLLVQGSKSTSSMPVVLGFYEGLAPLLLAPVLSRLDTVLPGIVIKPFLGSLEDIANGIGQSALLDCAITYDLGLDNAFCRDELARLPIQAVVSPDHKFARKGSATMAQVAAEQIIVTDEGLSKAHMLKLFNDRGHRLSIVHEASTMETMRSLAANNLGVGLSYTCPKADVTYDGKGVRQIPISDAVSTEPVIVASHRDNAMSASAEAVRGAILEMVFDL